MPYVPPYQQPVYVQPQYGQPSPYAAPMPYSPYGQAAVPGALYGVDPLTGIPLSDKSKSTAGLLQLFFGGFGVGRLYLGHTGIGVAQLMLTLFGLITTLFIVGGFILFGVGVWILIDAIMIFTGSVRDSNGRVLR
ncbi:TM2 domain-containing protein [Gordonia spumicola]|nr:TM2 domain-containing protein [Gordonia spumicola]